MPRIKVDASRLEQQARQHKAALEQEVAAAANLACTHLPTPHQVLLESGSLKLLRFDPSCERRLQTPLLICYALVNRPWILDLSAQHSMIRKLLDQGISVYMIDWGYPSRSDRHLGLEDYLTDLLDRCVDRVRQDSNTDAINLLGVCQGGVLSLCYSLMFATKVRNLVTLVTPIDTSVADFNLSRLTQTIDTQLAVATYGNLPGQLLNELFTALQPMRLGLAKRMAARQQLAGDAAAVEHYLRMEHWLQDCPDLAGEALKDFIRLFFRDNALMSAEGFTLGDAQLCLHDLKPPVLNIFGNRDQLVPPAASAALAGILEGRDYTEVAINAGHIGVLNGGKALNSLPPLIFDWLNEREPH